jgi:hypothetical protein
MVKTFIVLRHMSDKWNDKESVKQRKKFAKAFSNISDIDIRRPH